MSKFTNRTVPKHNTCTDTVAQTNFKKSVTVNARVALLQVSISAETWSLTSTQILEILPTGNYKLQSIGCTALINPR